MKFRSLLLASLLAVVGLAHAEHSATEGVQIYGVIDESVVSQTGSGLNAVNLNSSTTGNTYLGFSGLEKLGNGYGVGFNLETGINLSNGNTGNTLSGVGGTSAHNGYIASAGTASVFNRQANMQINVPVGMFKIGRQYTPSFMAAMKSDAIGITSGGMSTIFSTIGGSGNRYLTSNTSAPLNPDLNTSTNLGNPGLWTGGLSFRTNDYYGFTGSYMFGFNQSSGTQTGDTNVDAQALQDVSIAYAHGPMTSSLSYQRAYDNVGNMYNEGWLASLGYDVIEDVTVKGTYYSKRFGNCSQNTLGGNCMNKAMATSTTGVSVAATYAPLGTAYGDNFDVYALGASWQATSHVRLAIQVSQILDQVNSANKSRFNSLYGEYAFSKRTRVYALASYVVNEGQSNYSPIFGLPAQTSTPGNNITALALGIRTSF